jgi:hypothetical protein
VSAELPSKSEPLLKSTSKFFPFEARGQLAVEQMRLPLMIVSIGMVLARLAIVSGSLGAVYFGGPVVVRSVLPYLTKIAGH